MSKILLGDCVSRMKELKDNSIDLIVTDPPYGYSFMGKDWDKALPSIDIWKECLRVLKPGAFAFVMSAPRQDVMSRMILRLQDAGFKIDFTSIYWCYASGFSKASNIGKMIDKRLGIKGKIEKASGVGFMNEKDDGYHTTKNRIIMPERQTKEAQVMDGSYGGFQPKPATEVIIVAMKPLSERTYVDQALKNGKGVTWLDRCRIPYENSKDQKEGQSARQSLADKGTNQCKMGSLDHSNRDYIQGRFPANLLVSDDVLNENVYKLPLYGGGRYKDEDTGQWSKNDNVVEYALIDNTDVKLCNQYRWNLSTKGYVVCGEAKNRHIRLHRLIMNPDKGMDVDHINGDPLDNRRVNLRVCSHQQNMMNRNDGVGVYEYKDGRVKRFWAYITKEQKRKSLGYYNTFEEARQKYLQERKKMFGKFDRNNNNDSGSFSRYFDLDKWYQKQMEKTFPYLIVAKPSKGEKNIGCENMEEKEIRGGGGRVKDGYDDNDKEQQRLKTAAAAYGAVKSKRKNVHPTVKPLMLMSYLIILGSRKGDTILEPFMGSGTTCMAALILKRKFIGIEREKEYFEIAKARILGISKLIKEGSEREIKKVLKIK